MSYIGRSGLHSWQKQHDWDLMDMEQTYQGQSLGIKKLFMNRMKEMLIIQKSQIPK